MSLFQRAASLAAASLCLLGLNLATATRAAEPVTASTPATIGAAVSVAAPLLSATLTTATAVPVPNPPAPAPAAPVARFASLEDAVAAQDQQQDLGAGNTASDEVSCLAGAIYFEAKGEPLSGQLAVADVVLARAQSGRFPADVCGVVTQRGQFSFVRDGRVPAIDADARGYHTAVALARVALAKAWDSPAQGALFFHARREHARRGVQVAAIGNHIFYR